VHQTNGLEVPLAVDLDLDHGPLRVAARAGAYRFIGVDSEGDAGREVPQYGHLRQLPRADAASLGIQVPQRAVQGIARAARGNRVDKPAKSMPRSIAGRTDSICERRIGTVSPS